MATKNKPTVKPGVPLNCCSGAIDLVFETGGNYEVTPVNDLPTQAIRISHDKKFSIDGIVEGSVRKPTGRPWQIVIREGEIGRLLKAVAAPSKAAAPKKAAPKKKAAPAKKAAPKKKAPAKKRK